MVSVIVGVVVTRVVAATLSGTGVHVYTAHGLAGRGDGISAASTRGILVCSNKWIAQTTKEMLVEWEAWPSINTKNRPSKWKWQIVVMVLVALLIIVKICCWLVFSSLAAQLVTSCGITYSLHVLVMFRYCVTQQMILCSFYRTAWHAITRWMAVWGTVVMFSPLLHYLVTVSRHCYD